MSLRNKVFNLLLRLKFSVVPNHFVSKDDLFKLRFDENWVYSKKGNSFYSFHNQKDDLKGGLQFSISWYVRQPESMNEKEAVLHFIEADEKEKVDFQTVSISNLQAIHYSRSYGDSNMNFYYWYIYHEKIFIITTYMIFDEEPDNIKGKWLKRVTDILNSLELDIDKFQTTRMK
ncbi:MAG TPA: hypothetical protein VK589_14105 [Chryseolinea sp.]|nr:hypothetical protein [Chryseolinea sp.]